METSNIYTFSGENGSFFHEESGVHKSTSLENGVLSREHRYSIQKTFFTKKLEVAEAAVSQWYVSSNVLGSIARLYEQAPVLEKGIERDVFNIMNNSLTIQLNKLQEASNQIANSFLLYFDIDDSFWNNEALNNFLKCLSNLKVIITSLDMFHNLNSGIPENDYKKLIQKEIDRLNKELEKEMKNFVSFIDDSREGMITLLKKVRNEMKKYE